MRRFPVLQFSFLITNLRFAANLMTELARGSNLWLPLDVYTLPGSKYSLQTQETKKPRGSGNKTLVFKSLIRCWD